MENLLASLGLTMGELIGIAILAVALLVGLFLLRLIFRLTKGFFKWGCLVILLLVVALFILRLSG